MGKIKIDDGKELIARQAQFIEKFLMNNEIFKELKLTDEQMAILVEKKIMPEFYQVYDVTFRAKREEYFYLKA